MSFLNGTIFINILFEISNIETPEHSILTFIFDNIIFTETPIS